MTTQGVKRASNGSPKTQMSKRICPNASYVITKVEIADTLGTIMCEDGNEWGCRNGRRPEAITMGNSIKFNIWAAGKGVQITGGETLTVRIKVGDEKQAGYNAGLAETMDNGESANRYAVEVTNPARLGKIGKTQISLSGFKVNGSSSVRTSEYAVIFDIYTLYARPRDDNVKGRELASYNSEQPSGATGSSVQRIRPFWYKDHFDRATAWGAGTSDIEGIVLTTIRQCEIPYVRQSTYTETNDGWNVTDNPKFSNQAADCSQLASLFADALGTLGVCAHDFEISWLETYSRTLYRREFYAEPSPQRGKRDDRKSWNIHGVLLFKRPSGDIECYDTTFARQARLRWHGPLGEALAIGDQAPFIKAWAGWTKYVPSEATWAITGVPNDMKVDESSWRDRMVEDAQNLFQVAGDTGCEG